MLLDETKPSASYFIQIREILRLIGAFLRHLSEASELDWEDVKVVGALARHGTIRGAAKSLSVHHSTISRRVASLENALGARLFDRTPEGYALTEAGEHIALSAKTMESEIQRAGRLVSGGDREMSGRLLVTMAEPVAQYAFAPRLPDFVRQYPNLEIEITSTTNMIDLARRKADIAVRMNNNPHDSLFGKRLFTYCNAAYASAAYLAEHDLAQSPEDANWIGWDGSFERFPQWTVDTGLSAVPVWGNFPALEMQAALARAGMGIAMLPCFMGDHDPDLVRASARPPVPGRDVWILTHSDLRRTSRVRAFMRFAEDVLLENKNRFIGHLTN